MNIFTNIKYNLANKISNISSYFYVKHYKKLYPDYKDDSYNCGDLKHIWGIESWDDLSGKDCNFYTMNDIDITYDRKSKKYYLGIETAYMFDGDRKEGECKYLKDLLEAFTKFMDDNNYKKDHDMCLLVRDTSIDTEADSIEELYMNFKIFVEGYCKVYGYEIN